MTIQCIISILKHIVWETEKLKNGNKILVGQAVLELFIKMCEIVFLNFNKIELKTFFFFTVSMFAISKLSALMQIVCLGNTKMVIKF